MNRKKVLLAVLFLLFVGATISAYLRWPRQQSAKGSGAAVQGGGPAPARPAARPVVTPPDDRIVRLDLLRQEGQRFSGFRRNIFRPVSPSETLPGGRRPLTVLPPPPPPAPPVVAPPPAVAQPTPVQRDMARFTFLGFLKKDAKKTIFLSKDNKIFLVKKGDRIDGKYEATEISDDALTIRVMADGTDVVIPLQENRPLAAR